MHNKITKSKNKNINIGYIGFVFFVLFLVLLHSVISLFHYHECDSSFVYKLLTESSLYSRVDFLRRIEITSPIIFAPIRIILGFISEYLPLQPLRASILLSLKTTYPLLEGFVYGFNIPRSFDKFYDFASFVNILFLLIGFFLFYKSCIKVGVGKIISFSLSFGMLNLYSINSYSYHLGSTNWFIFSSCLCIYSAVHYQFKRSKLTYPIALLSSYPSLIFFGSQIISSYIFSRFIPRRNIFNKGKSYYINYLMKIYRENIVCLYTFLIIFICFFPFNSGLRTPFDNRGFFTLFSLFPLQKDLDIYSILIASFVYLFIFIAYFCFFSNKAIFRNNNLNLKSLNNVFEVITLNLFLLTILISLKSFTFSTTRHSIFIIPYLVFLSAIGLQCIKNYFYLINKKIIYIFNLILIMIFSLTFVSSLYSSYLRLDPLKTKPIPTYIREFVEMNPANTISLLDCDIHYLYNNFSKKRATYDKKDPYVRVPINQLGTRLLISQRIDNNIINNFDLSLKKGDELVTPYKEVKVLLAEDPYIIEKNIYFDSINYKKNSKSYYQESNQYSRPNNVYIFPIKVNKAAR